MPGSLSSFIKLSLLSIEIKMVTKMFRVHPFDIIEVNLVLLKINQGPLRALPPCYELNSQKEHVSFLNSGLAG
jgi:hypothetical protein